MASDEVRQLYLGLLVEAPGGKDAFLLTPISSERLHQLETGVFDVRSALETPEVNEYYLAALQDNTSEGNRLPVSPAGVPPEEWLPDPDLRVSDFMEPDAVMHEVATRGKAVVHLWMTPPETHSAPQIGVTNLTTGLSLFQNLVCHAYRRVLRDVNHATRKVIADKANWTMDVFGFSSGSFTIHMQSRLDPDLLGFVGLSRALVRVDSLTERIDEPEASISIVRENRGHFVDAYRRLLKFMIESESGLGYQWSAPDRLYLSTRKISRSSAERLYSLIIEQQDLMVEEVTIIGVFIHVNVESGLWTLRDDEGIPHHGGLASGSRVTLSGVVVDIQRYQLDCIERVEETGAGELRTILELRGVEPIDRTHS